MTNIPSSFSILLIKHTTLHIEKLKTDLPRPGNYTQSLAFSGQNHKIASFGKVI